MQTMYGYGNGWVSGSPGDIILPVVGSVTAWSDLGRLPEDVRAAVEERRDEIHSEEDLRRLIAELLERR